MKINEQIVISPELLAISQRFSARTLREQKAYRAYQQPPAHRAGDVYVLCSIAKRIPAILIGLVVNLLRS